MSKTAEEHRTDPESDPWPKVLAAREKRHREAVAKEFDAIQTEILHLKMDAYHTRRWLAKELADARAKLVLYEGDGDRVMHTGADPS